MVIIIIGKEYDVCIMWNVKRCGSNLYMFNIGKDVIIIECKNLWYCKVCYDLRLNCIKLILIVIFLRGGNFKGFKVLLMKYFRSNGFC